MYLLSFIKQKIVLSDTKVLLAEADFSCREAAPSYLYPLPLTTVPQYPVLQLHHVMFQTHAEDDYYNGDTIDEDDDVENINGFSVQ